MQYYESNESVGMHLFGAVNDYSKSVALWDFVNNLGSEKCRVVRLMHYGMTDAEIMDSCRLSDRTYYGMLEELQKDFQVWQAI